MINPLRIIFSGEILLSGIVVVTLAFLLDIASNYGSLKSLEQQNHDLIVETVTHMVEMREELDTGLVKTRADIKQLQEKTRKAITFK